MDTTITTVQTVQPFVGVCGAQSTEDLWQLEQLAQRYLTGTGRYIMAGIPHNSQHSIQSYQSEIVRPFMHCDFSAAESFEELIERTLKTSKGFVRGLQLNILPWLEEDYAPLWKKIKKHYPSLILVLQVPKVMLQRYSPEQIAQGCEGLDIDFILFDPSQSQGEPYNPDQIYHYIAALRTRSPSIGIAVAGGLEGSTIPTLFQPLEERFPGLSCDARKRLENPQTHLLHWPAVAAYLAAWRKAVGLQRA